MFAFGTPFVQKPICFDWCSCAGMPQQTEPVGCASLSLSVHSLHLSSAVHVLESSAS